MSKRDTPISKVRVVMIDEPTLPPAVSTALARYRAAKAKAQVLVDISVGLERAVYAALPPSYLYRGIIIKLEQCITESGDPWAAWLVFVDSEVEVVGCCRSTKGQLLSGYIEGIKVGQRIVDSLLSGVRS